MNNQRWLQPLLITLLLCCAAPLSVADDEPAATPQKQKATEHLAQSTKPFTIAVLPDTQFYCDTRLKLSAKWGNGDLRRYFFAQTKWVRDNQKRLNIAFLVHEGDIVQADFPEEWAIAKKAMSVLDGKVPYCMCLGNHDMGFEKADNKYGGNIGVNRTTHFNTYFPRDKFAKRREFGGTFDPDRHDNSWYHFEAAGMSFLIVALECKPRDEVLDWANKIVAKHPDHRVIVLTHAYMNASKSRNTGGMKAKGNTGEQTWQKFVKKHKNIFMVLCGHHTGEAVRTDAGDHGNKVHQILCDYQHLNNGGESWLRYMVFKPAANKISIYTYNPVLDKFKKGSSSRFDLDYPMTLLPKARAANALNKTNPVKALADRVRGHVNSQPLRFPNQHWVRGTYYAGLLAMYESTSDSAYLDDCMEWGKKVAWQIKEKGDGPYDSGAYPLICGQIWVGCYRAKKDELMMQPTLAFLENPNVTNPLSAPKEWYLENTGHHFVDGLFTAPPALAMLYQMTGEEKYVNWMDACFWDVHEEIYDPDADLFYRDARSKPRKTKNGKKVLWSRGNGWAFGGLTRILKHLPSDHRSYARYKALYIQMAESLAKRQLADGFWRSNLDDPEHYTMKESSGTAFFCYGITWGINNGILNRERFLPVARKAWTALASVVNEDGKVGWSQPAGGGPGKVAEADTSKFGTGIFLLAASEVFLLTQSPAASKPLGLRPGPNATILLNGKPYRGIGMNYFSCFLRTLKNGNDTSYDAGFATLAEKGIPFARFCATGFWPRDMKLYVEDREEYFRRLDGVVHSAEKHGIGLIPSLFWYYACVPDLVDEPMDQWANPQSKTQAWMRKYVREVVTRYRDNPTIWAWEFGNEFSLHGDLPNAERGRPKTHRSLGTPDSRSARDDLTYEMIGKAFTAFATAVRKHDPHRLIFTGDSFPRLSAWHQEQEGSWKHDSMKQFAEMLTKANPDPISGISLHAYEDDDQRLDVAMAVARKLNKPVFVGEFGAQHETPEQSAKCRRLLKAIIDHKIPLAALWVFDHPRQKDFNVTADNGRAWQLDLIAEANRKLRTQARDVVHADVCVYGGTPGGVTAAISAAREGASVVLLEQTRHVGGLSTSGLNRDEGEHMDRATLGGLCQYFTAEAARRSGSNTEAIKRGARKWQSKHAEQVFLDMLKDAGVLVLYEQLLEKVEKNGTRITKLKIRNGTTYHAKVFLDATYEGDLMAAAGVSYAVGREARDTYDEEKAGVRYMDEKVKVSPYDEDGNLLFGVMPGPAPEEFGASEHPMCYNVRLNLTTDKANMVSIGQPANYDPKQHELLARCIEAGDIKRLGAIIGLYPMPGSQKRELNNRQFSYVSMSIPGAQTAWSEASFEEREKIHQQYRDYTHGMLWFLKSDPRVPESIRQDMGQYGFCKDEWTDNNHWPWYLYIRAARRMKGRYVLTQHDVTKTSDKDDVIHIGSHFIDSHQVTRYAIDKDHFINEGRMWQKGMRFDIPYRAMTPKAEECENLLVPVCVSASNVAFAAIRLEPTWMHLGEAAGIAAVMAGNNSVQSVDVTKLQERIGERGIPLEIPEGQAMTDAKSAKKGDVVAQLFAAADLDLNGTVSKTEWSMVRVDWAWLFPVMDKNGDGQLERAEYKAFQIYKKENPDWYKLLRDGLNQGGVKQRP